MKPWKSIQRKSSKNKGYKLFFKGNIKSSKIHNNKDSLVTKNAKNCYWIAR